MSKKYSSKWFQTFCVGLDPQQTASEVAFLCNLLPLPGYRRVLDVGCGMGRHVHGLALAGYEVTGLEANAEALAVARMACGDAARLLPGEMRDMAWLDHDFDAVICMWATFGIFSPAENADVLASMAARLRAGGRLVLDVYDPKFFKEDATRRPFERNGARGMEHSTIRGGCRHVRLTYTDSEVIDEFQWQLFTVDQLESLAEPIGLKRLCACSGFDEGEPASGQRPRMQVVFESNRS